MTRLLCVTHYFDSHRGGIELVAGRLNAELAALGHEVTWAAADATPPPSGNVRSLAMRAWNGLERRTGLPMPLPSLKAIRALDRAVAAADAVMIHDALYATSLLAFLMAKRRGRPVVLVQHIAAIPFRRRLLRALMRAANRIVTRPMLARAGQSIFISRTVADAFANVRYRRPPVTIFNGVDTDLFRPALSTAERDADRAATGLMSGRPVALFVGRFVEKKGLARLRLMALARPDVHFAFAGWGPLDPASWGLPNVTLHRDLAGPALARLYRAADLLVLPSTGEGFPLVVQEALATGLAVLCDGEAAAADPAARPYVYGARVVPGDDRASADYFLRAMEQVLGDAADSAAAAARARFAAERYAWASCARQHAAIIDEVLYAGAMTKPHPSPEPLSCRK